MGQSSVRNAGDSFRPRSAAIRLTRKRTLRAVRRQRGFRKNLTGGHGWSHNDLMEIKAVGTKALRDRLTAYLREVRQGVKILVLDHDRVIAELHEPTMAYTVPASAETVDRWEREGVLIRGRRSDRPGEQLPLHLADGTAKSLLDAERGERSLP
jgi:antitoxin (DNA-binding transcriptional repressor) of toxin-antitoxin stability system